MKEITDAIHNMAIAHMVALSMIFCALYIASAEQKRHNAAIEKHLGIKPEESK